MAKKAEKSPVSGTRIDWIPLAQLQAATRNPKRHSAEIAPVYVQVAIERWERCTGKKAERG
jgi:hypothetical protein